MSPSPRRRYSHLPVGLFELLPISIAKTKPTPLLLLAWLYVSPLRRTIPGLIIAGPVALADAIGWSVAGTKRCLDALEQAGIIRVDGERRSIVSIRRAIADDAPKNENVLKAWAAQLEELPPCPVVAEIIDAVEASIVSLDKAHDLCPKWRHFTDQIKRRSGNSSPDSSVNSFRNSLRNSRGTPVPTPIPNSETASATASVAGTDTGADSTTGKREIGSCEKGFTRIGSGPHRRA